MVCKVDLSLLSLSLPQLNWFPSSLICDDLFHYKYRVHVLLCAVNNHSNISLWIHYSLLNEDTSYIRYIIYWNIQTSLLGKNENAGSWARNVLLYDYNIIYICSLQKIIIKSKLSWCIIRFLLEKSKR